ncbi:unnamed protein product [Candida verbasci]|uniref:Uncharacterized protein n=1 Tax=Candida verbasci TaxID=1227364 RepID=A0A9W4TTH5_9ASCO|nr:unnamed protein product [Candida verbasci]
MPQRDLSGIQSTATNEKIMDVEDHEINLQTITSSNFTTSFNDFQKQLILKRLNLNNIIDSESLPPAAVFMIEKVENLSVETAIPILEETLKEHQHDVNFPTADFDFIKELVDAKDSKEVSVDSEFKENSKEAWTEDIKEVSTDEDPQINEYKIVDLNLQIRLEAALIAYWSPYPEVRSVTDPYDDPSIPAETLRVYILGTIWTALGTFINQFFIERQPAISLSPAVVQLFLYPCGLILAKILPKYKLKLWKFTIDLNPGPWNHKEQMLATIFYSVSSGVSYVSYNIHAQRVERFYNNQWADWGYQVLLILATNYMGIGFAGIIRRFAVFSPRAVWPTILPTIALNKALLQPESKEIINGWSISRYRWFFSVLLISFLYNWIPTYLFNALSYFNWTTWISPNNVDLVAVTGFVTGLGLNPIPSFDWNLINYNSGLILPFYSQGVRYDVKNVVDDNNLFDQVKYESVGPPYYSAANLVLYGSFIAFYPFSIVYECFINGKPMLRAIKELIRGFRNLKLSVYEGFNDPQTIMMRKYKEVPDWVFLLVLVVSIVFGIICVSVYSQVQTPIWGLFFALGINLVFLFPLTMIFSTTGYQIGLNVLGKYTNHCSIVFNTNFFQVQSYALEGNGLALMFIKAFGYNINGQAQNYISDQKLGHYLKIAPRAVFRCQMFSVLISSFVGLAVMNFTIDNIPNYCDYTNTQKFTCPSSTVFYTASILWGVIGPRKVFGGLYPILAWCFLIGFLLAFPAIAFKKYGPKRITKYFQPSVIIGGMLIYAPYNLSYITGSLYLSIASMWYLKSRYLAWWSKYNFVFSCAMDAGVAASAILIFFAVQYKEYYLNWWGNTVSFAGIEGMGGLARLNATTAPEGYFGLRPNEYP